MLKNNVAAPLFRKANAAIGRSRYFSSFLCDSLNKNLSSSFRSERKIFSEERHTTLKSSYNPDAKRFAILSAGGPENLANEVAASLGLSLGRCSVRTPKETGETEIKIIEKIANRHVFIFHSVNSPEKEKSYDNGLLESILLAFAAKRCGARKLSFVSPFLPYYHVVSNPLVKNKMPASDIAHLLSTVGFQNVVFMDIHQNFLNGVFPPPLIPCINVLSAPVFFSYLSECNLHCPAVIGTVDGPFMQSEALCKRFKGQGYNTALCTMTEQNTRVIGEVAGRDCVLIDNFLKKPSENILPIAKTLKKNGAERVFVLAPYATWNGDELASLAADPHTHEIITTNAIYVPAEKQTDNMTVLSISKEVAKQLRSIAHDDR